MSREFVWLCPAESLPEGHPCRGKYRTQYLDPINEIAGAGMETATWPDGEKLPGVVITYVFGEGRRVRAQVCYADYPDEELLGAPDVDMVIKLKYADRCRAQYEAHSVPVFPGGFLGGPQRGEDLPAGRRWFQRNLQGLREIGDGIMRSAPPPYHAELVTNGCTEGGEARGGFGALGDLVIPLPKLNRLPFADHMVNIASARYCLNICGNGNSIDRKVVDYCGIGAAILSTRGLEDYVGPRWARFEHRENIWFVDSVPDLASAMEMSREERDRLVIGSRRLYERCFSPVAMSSWWRQCAVDVLLAR